MCPNCHLFVRFFQHNCVIVSVTWVLCASSHISRQIHSIVYFFTKIWNMKYVSPRPDVYSHTLGTTQRRCGPVVLFYLWACCNILSFHHSIEVFCTVHSLIAKCTSSFIAVLLNCYKLAMTLAVSSSSWNVLLIFSCVSFEVLYSIERACENAQLPKISHSDYFLENTQLKKYHNCL